VVAEQEMQRAASLAHRHALISKTEVGERPLAFGDEYFRD